MSRETKFRVWIKSWRTLGLSKGMYPVADLVWWDCGPNEGKLFEAVVAEGWGFNVPEEAILMQYTGLKDKNGKEIYEGDIVQNTYYNTKGAIKWDEEECRYGRSYRIVGITLRVWQYEAADYFIVIGNIYENPEILEAEKVDKDEDEDEDKDEDEDED